MNPVPDRSQVNHNRTSEFMGTVQAIKAASPTLQTEITAGNSRAGDN